MTDSNGNGRDYIDLLIARWAQRRPGFDLSGLAVTGRFRLLVLLLDGVAASVGECHGVKRGELQILLALCRRGEPYSTTPTELAQEVWITAASITRRIDQLVKLGLVERERDSLDDRREVLVRLTSRGQEVALAALSEAVTSEARMIEGLDAREKEVLVGLLRKLLLSIGTPEGIPPGRLFRSTRALATAAQSEPAALLKRLGRPPILPGASRSNK